MSSPVSSFAFNTELRQHFQTDVSAVRNQSNLRNKAVREAENSTTNQAVDKAVQLSAAVRLDRASLTGLRDEIKGYRNDFNKFQQALKSGDSATAHAALQQVRADRLQ